MKTSISIKPSGRLRATMKIASTKSDKIYSDMAYSELAYNELKSLYQNLGKIKNRLVSYQRKHQEDLHQVHPVFKRSAVNLLHYLALRKADLKNIQLRLARAGLSSLGASESFVMSNLQQTLLRLHESLSYYGHKASSRKKESLENQFEQPALDWLTSETKMHENARAIFGPKPAGRHVYIMVTAPTATEVTANWVQNILSAGANLIRLNCAHGTLDEWKKTIRMIRKVASQQGVTCKILMDLGGPKIRVLEPKKTVVKVGDHVCLRAKDEKLASPKYKYKEIVCSVAEIFPFLRVRHRTLFDDGKVEGVIRQKGARHCLIEITRTTNSQAKEKDKVKIRHEKGINFPDSNLQIAEITDVDLEDLRFVARNADMVGISFVQNPESIALIRKELDRLGKSKTGIVLKIETKAGFKALPKLLLEAMGHFPIAVMIARGDLAVEVGFGRMVEVQEQILRICEAAHVPTIWATQVLETLAKSGLPSRAEVTDAALAVRAECVMLNKGPHIDMAVRSLDNILIRMEKHFYKKRNIYRRLKVAKL